ncbi:hypothetical protein ACVW0Y_003705 [Pseudomonas sp. TE3786]
MQESAKVMEMAGYCAAHSIWSVCDGQALIPLVGYLGTDDKCSMERLATGPLQGEHRLASLHGNQLGAVLIKDGCMPLGSESASGKSACLILDVRFAAAPHCKLQYVLPYRSGLHEKGFAVHNPVLSECQGFDGEQVEILGQFFFRGLAAHTQGSAIWHSHYQPQMDQHCDPAGHFTLEELQLLRRAPLLVFRLMAGNQGALDKASLPGLARLLATAGNYLNPLLSRLVGQLSHDLSTLAADMQAGKGSAAAELLVIRQVFEAHLPAAESRAFAQALLALASDIGALPGIDRRRQAAVASCLGLAEV